LGASNDNQVVTNDVFWCENYGIQLVGSNSNTIAENKVCFNVAGIGLYASSDENVIEGNNASYNVINGIDLDDCRDNVVRWNRAHHNEWTGIGLYLGCEKNVVKDNNIRYNNWAGISLTECEGNVIARNNVTRNVMGGIKLQGSRDNLLFQNGLVENAVEGTDFKATSPLIESLLGMAKDERVRNAYDDALNRWDNGTIGNHYSDFDCTDASGDGICDSERAIPGGESVDRYPLARPRGGD
jgi:parallel beta-helix repeat protein